MSETPLTPGGPVRTVDAGGVDEAAFLSVLRTTIDALEEADVPHLLMGGLAVAALGRPRWTHDIDIFVRPDDAQRALAVLEERGFETEETDPLWLFKAIRDDIVVDIIFRSEGQIYLEDEMLQRAIETTFRGERVCVIPPEDLILIKASAHKEEGGYHWFDALALLTRPGLDWDYLVRRSRRAVRRVLSLLLYAQSSDIAVPRAVVHQLIAQADLADDGEPVSRPVTPRTPRVAAEDLRERLEHDPRVGDLDVRLAIHGDTVLLTGEVTTEERSRLLGQVVEELAPGLRVDNRTTVRRMREPNSAEEVEVTPR